MGTFPLGLAEGLRPRLCIGLLWKPAFVSGSAKAPQKPVSVIKVAINGPAPYFLKQRTISEVLQLEFEARCCCSHLFLCDQLTSTCRGTQNLPPQKCRWSHTAAIGRRLSPIVFQHPEEVPGEQRHSNHFQLCGDCCCLSDCAHQGEG